MNIGIVTTWFERGAAYVSKQFEEELSKEHSVFIYARGGEEYAKGSPKWDQENVTWGKRNLTYKPTQINKTHFKNWIEENKIELIIFNEQRQWEPIAFVNQLGVITGGYIDYYKEETVPLFGIYDFLICNTKRHYSVFDWHSQAFYVPWGTDIDLFTPKEKSYDDGTITFFHSCGMNPNRKGTDFLLEAYSKIDREDSLLIIHSQVDLKKFFPEKKELIDKLLYAESLQLIEKTVSAPGLYHLGDVYVYPSRLEGIGLTIAEAISCGLPAIVTDEQPMNEFVKQSESGRLVDVAYKEKRRDDYYWPQSIVNIDSLKEEMSFYLANKENVKDFKVKAREYAKMYLNWEKNFQHFSSRINRIKKIESKNAKQLRQKVARLDEKESIFQKIKKSLAFRKLISFLKGLHMVG